MLWFAALWLAPAAAAASSARELQSAFAALVYTIGSMICHQRPERSFSAGALPLPVCARCTGVYVGGAIGSCVALALARSRSRRLDARRIDWRRALVAAAIPTAVTLAYEWTSGSVPSNSLRAAAGIPLGLAVGFIVAGRDQVN
jgi:uncharacterized membrane protein